MKLLNTSIIYISAMIIISAVIIPQNLTAQCSSSLKTVTYNYFMNGTGNDSWSFSFPQFNPSLGTLVAVDLKSVVSVNFNFIVQNNGLDPDNYNVTVGRIDNISFDVSGTPVSSSYASYFGPYTIGPDEDTVGAGTVELPLYFPLLRSYVINDSITDAVAGFLGTNPVTFNYKPFTYAAVTLGSNFFLNSSASDTMYFSMTYYYCDAGLLPESITDFTAAKENSISIKLLWQTVNEETGKTYEIQKSADENSFTDIYSLQSEPDKNKRGNYSYIYTIENNDKNKLYFRLKEIDSHGIIKYSEIRMVDIGDGNGKEMYVFPNPSSSYINIFFNQPIASNWQVQIFAAHGGLVQSNSFINTARAYIPFTTKLAAGVYFIRATDMQTRKNYISKFLVR
jgi:type IX secretion system substrate protein